MILFKPGTSLPKSAISADKRQKNEKWNCGKEVFFREKVVILDRASQIHLDLGFTYLTISSTMNNKIIAVWRCGARILEFYSK